MPQREGTDHANPMEARDPARKPYRKPAVRHERVFETSALTCGKVITHGSQCGTKKAS